MRWCGRCVYSRLIQAHNTICRGSPLYHNYACSDVIVRDWEKGRPELAKASSLCYSTYAGVDLGGSTDNGCRVQWCAITNTVLVSTILRSMALMLMAKLINRQVPYIWGHISKYASANTIKLNMGTITAGRYCYQMHMDTSTSFLQ